MLERRTAGRFWRTTGRRHFGVLHYEARNYLRNMDWTAPFPDQHHPWGCAFQVAHWIGSHGKAFCARCDLICPILAVIALWARQLQMGLVLLAISMSSSLAFGIYKHFVASGPDRIGGQGPGLWSAVFAITAVLLAIAECAGTYIGLHFLRALRRNYSIADLT
jgi:hypothetical protein